MRKSVLFYVLAALFAAVAEPLRAQVTLNFDMGRRGPAIDNDHYGIFFEEINHAGDGGLYAELIKNRSFEENADTPESWSLVGSGTIKLNTEQLLNIHQGHSLELVTRSTSTGILNSGWWGIKYVSGKVYDLSFWVMSPADVDCKFVATLQNADGSASCGRANINVSLLAGQWQKVTASIKATRSVDGGSFCLRPGVKGTFYLDVISLFPPTFKGYKNGLREDLAQMLYDLRPGFVRFPGGCFVEGLFANGKTNHFEWKKTIGPIEERPGHRNQNWGYQVTDGLGYHEYLEMCEALEASAMFVVNMGWGHDWQVSIDDIGPFIQDALDAVEYAMGDTTTTYGHLRAVNGHPAPFDLKYLEIGNENEWFDNYPGRYAEFYKAIKSRWPQLHLIANGSWNNAFPAEICDEHYYTSPEWMVSQYGKYDSYPRSRTKVYVGEYAVTQNPGRYGNLSAAIGEAVFMQGMENNSDVCVMASYAPIFANENFIWWHPDMIRFNANKSYGTPSYYVQQLFANNVGRQNIKWTETNNVPPATDPHASIGIGTWATAATFSNLTVTATEQMFTGAGTAETDWTVKDGTWTVKDGVFRQTSTSAAPAYCTYNTPFENTNLTLTVNATKNSGSEGFLILIDYRDDQNYTWWNIGGWGNTKHGIECCTGGSKQLVTDKSGQLETGKEYAIRVVKEGDRCRCYLDNELIHDFTLGGAYDRAIFTSASIDDDTGKLYVKLVNPFDQAVPTTLTFENGRVTAATCQLLTSARGTDENTTATPRAVVPVTKEITLTSQPSTLTPHPSSTLTYTVPAFSVNCLVLDVSDVTIPTETVDLPEPAVRYSFEGAAPADDSGVYPATLAGAAAIATMPDGNRALYTGQLGGKGYLDMGEQMPRDVLAALTDYTISIDILLGVNNTTSSFCWGYALANGTNYYIGLVNAGGNRDWYYELKDGKLENLHGQAGLNPTLWHNIIYTQKDGTGYYYIDGQLRDSRAVSIDPQSLSQRINTAWLARSPFGGDAYLENAYIDNFCIYNTALTAEQVNVLAGRATQMTPTPDVFSGITDQQDLKNLVLEVKNYVNSSGDEALKKAYTTAARYVNNSSSAAAKTAKDNLETAARNYADAQWQLMAQGQAADLTFLLRNSSFTLGPAFWQGTELAFTPVNGINGVVTGFTNETSEQFTRSFDIYQVINGLPTGTYELTASAFYRAGSKAAAYEAFNSQAEDTQLTELYLNSEAQPVVSLFSEQAAYSYDPYTYPDNLTAASRAFNRDSLYADNRVTVELAEGQPLRCGIRKLSTLPSDWVAYDNFRLRYLGQPTGIRDAGAERQAAILRTEVFLPSGQRSSLLRTGVNILRHVHADGTVTARKVLVR